MTFRDETHPLVEVKYLAEFEQGRFDPNHVAATVEHYLRLGPDAGDDRIKRTLVHGGVNIRLWTANAIANRMTLQRQCIRLSNEWLKSRGLPCIDIDRLDSVQEALRPFILPNEMYKSLGSHFVADSIGRSCQHHHVLYRDLSKTIVDWSVRAPKTPASSVASLASTNSPVSPMFEQTKRSLSTRAMTTIALRVSRRMF
jgi:hypothetical protein